MIASRLSGFGISIFTEMSALAVETGAINLGQGFPDEDGPAAVLEAAQAAMRNGHNQYAPLPGRAGAARGDRRAPAALLRARGRPRQEVQVTMGATEAITAAILGLCEPGDEVLAFDPTYDSYGAAATMTGARSCRPAAPAGLARSTPTSCAPRSPRRTRAILVNSPHNPTGRVLTRDELEPIAARRAASTT